MHAILPKRSRTLVLLHLQQDGGDANDAQGLSLASRHELEIARNKRLRLSADRCLGGTVKRQAEDEFGLYDVS